MDEPGKPALSRPLSELLRSFDFDVRTLTNTITGFSEMLADPGRDMPMSQRLEYAEIVFEASLALQVEICAIVSLAR